MYIYIYIYTEGLATAADPALRACSSPPCGRPVIIIIIIISFIIIIIVIIIATIIITIIVSKNFRNCLE